MTTEVFFNRPARPIPLDRLLADIRGAQEDLYVACAWFTLDAVADAIIAAPAKNKWIALNGADLARLNRAGERVIQRIMATQEEVSLERHWSEFRVAILGNDDYREGIMHHKFIVVDRRVVWTGSYNFTYQAAKNYETLIRMDDPVIAQAFSAEACTLVWEERSLWKADYGNWGGTNAFRCVSCQGLFASDDPADEIWPADAPRCHRCAELVGAEGVH